MAATAGTENLPVAFAALLAGGLLLEHGTTTLRTAFGGSSGGVLSGAVAAASPSSPGSHGLVTTAKLDAIGAKHGWTGAQIADWMNVIKAESNGTLTDTNPTSGAYGIAQGITGPSWYAANGGSADTVDGQLTAMANYIAGRYGTPSEAWAHEQTQHWY